MRCEAQFYYGCDSDILERKLEIGARFENGTTNAELPKNNFSVWIEKLSHKIASNLLIYIIFSEERSPKPGSISARFICIRQ